MKFQKTKTMVLDGYDVQIDQVGTEISEIRIFKGGKLVYAIPRESGYSNVTILEPATPKMVDRFRVTVSLGCGRESEQLFVGEYEAKNFSEEMIAKGSTAKLETVKVPEEQE